MSKTTNKPTEELEPSDFVKKRLAEMEALMRLLPYEAAQMLNDMKKEGTHMDKTTCIRLFHGREDPNKDMADEKGEEGPVLGPFTFVQTVYKDTIMLGDPTAEGVLMLHSVGDCFYYRKEDGSDMFYGEYSVACEDIFKQDTRTIEKYDGARTEIPVEFKRKL